VSKDAAPLSINLRPFFIRLIKGLYLGENEAAEAVGHLETILLSRYTLFQAEIVHFSFLGVNKRAGLLLPLLLIHGSGFLSECLQRTFPMTGTVFAPSTFIATPGGTRHVT